MQCFTLEYRVQNRIDGVTVSPAFITDDTGSPDAAVPNDANIYEFTVEDLGLIDPDFGGSNGSFGDRFISNIWINSPVPGDAGAIAAVVSNRVRELTQEVVLDYVGETNVYSDTCIFVPQGSVLGLVGFDASAVQGDIIVRLEIAAAESLEEYALMLESCCCSLTACVAPEIETVEPDVFVCSGGIDTVVVTGGPFSPDAEVSIDPLCINPGGMTLVDFRVISPTTIEIDVQCSGFCNVDLTISNGPGCSVTLEAAFGTVEL